MKRPAFQFYPADWRNNAKLRRCSVSAQGAWINVLCLMHDSDEYGVLRWPLAEIAHAAGLPVKLLRELAEKGVIKGGDQDVESFVFVPTHGGRDGKPATLLEASKGPMWYCSRFVVDEHKRKNAGVETRFKPTNPPGRLPPSQPPTPPPTRWDGMGQGDGSSSTASTAVRSINGLRVLAAGALDPPVDNPEPRRIDSTSTPRAAAHSLANAERVKAENAIARAKAVPPPEGLIKRRPAGNDEEHAA
jgi:hypothetical protein